MVMPKSEHQEELVAAWRTYLDSLEKSLKLVDGQIQEAREMTGICTEEWCEATQHYIDDIANALFSISEPRWSNAKDSERIRTLKRRVYDLYADYREVYQKAG